MAPSHVTLQVLTVWSSSGVCLWLSISICCLFPSISIRLSVSFKARQARCSWPEMGKDGAKSRQPHPRWALPVAAQHSLGTDAPANICQHSDRFVRCFCQSLFILFHLRFPLLVLSQYVTVHHVHVYDVTSCAGQHQCFSAACEREHELHPGCRGVLDPHGTGPLWTSWRFGTSDRQTNCNKASTGLSLLLNKIKTSSNIA